MLLRKLAQTKWGQCVCLRQVSRLFYRGDSMAEAAAALDLTESAFRQKFYSHYTDGLGIKPSWLGSAIHRYRLDSVVLGKNQSTFVELTPAEMRSPANMLARTDKYAASLARRKLYIRQRLFDNNPTQRALLEDLMRPGTGRVYHVRPPPSARAVSLVCVCRANAAMRRSCDTEAYPG
jgi:hypothetical protein